MHYIYTYTHTFLYMNGFLGTLVHRSLMRCKYYRVTALIVLVLLVLILIICALAGAFD